MSYTVLLKEDTNDIRTYLKALFPDFNWHRFEELRRAMNYELWQGPMPADYWKEAEPLEHYKWKGWERAVEDIENMLSLLPTEVYYDLDTNCVLLDNPEDDEENWENETWTGNDYTVVEVAKALLPKSLYYAIF